MLAEVARLGISDETRAADHFRNRRQRVTQSDVDLLGDLDRIVDLDAYAAHRVGQRGALLARAEHSRRKIISTLRKLPSTRAWQVGRFGSRIIVNNRSQSNSHLGFRCRAFSSAAWPVKGQLIILLG